MMAFAWVALWIMAILMAGFSPPKSGVRWAAATAFAGGCGALSATIDDIWIPWLENQHLIHWWLDETFWRWIESCCSMLSLWGLPILFLQFAFIHAGLMKTHQWSMIRISSFIPFLLMCVIDYPAPGMSFSFGILSIWATPYLLGGSIILIHKQLIESNHFIRANRRTTNLITIPPITFHLISNYILRAFGIENLWPWNAAMISCLFLGFIWFAIKSGVFGIRLHAEQQRHDLNWRSVRAGTATIHHALNGEMSKMLHAFSACKKQLLQYESAQERELDLTNQIIPTFDLIEQSVQRSQLVLRRMRQQLGEIEIEKTTLDLAEWLPRKIWHYHHIAANRAIQVSILSGESVPIRVDELHLGEVIENIIRNAMDAIGPSGIIEISWIRQRKGVMILVRDSGCGIDPKHWRSIFQPFYTTKAGKDNYGFGLFYAYEVMQRHGGWIDVHSEIGKGTTMTLMLPKQCLA